MKDQDVLKQEWLLEGDGRRAVLFIHGINGTPLHMLPFAKAAQELGYTSRVILLPGHCMGQRALRDVKAEEWQDKVREEYDTLQAEYDEVTVVGFSLGAALTLNLCLERDVSRAVLIAPPLYLWTEKVLSPEFIRNAGAVFRWLPVFKSYGDMEIDGQQYRVPINNNTWMHSKSLFEADRVIKQVAPRLEEIQSDLLIMQAKGDMVIDIKSSEELFQRCGSTRKERILIKSRHHTFFMEDKQQESIEHISRYLLR